MQVDITIFPTPNPNALKFVLDQKVIGQGKVTFKDPQECAHIPLAHALLQFKEIESIHFFDNFITVTKKIESEWEPLESLLESTIREHFPKHDASFEVLDPEVERRKNLPLEMQQIEEILDKTIRPGLQGDGGDLECLEFKEDVLTIRYQGACGTCPSSAMGTLEAIKRILSDELNRPIEVMISPDSNTMGSGHHHSMPPYYY